MGNVREVCHVELVVIVKVVPVGRMKGIARESGNEDGRRADIYDDGKVITRGEGAGGDGVGEVVEGVGEDDVWRGRGAVTEESGEERANVANGLSSNESVKFSANRVCRGVA